MSVQYKNFQNPKIQDSEIYKPIEIASLNHFPHYSIRPGLINLAYLEHVKGNVMETLGVICEALEVRVSSEHYLEYIQEELERVLVQEVDLPENKTTFKYYKILKIDFDFFTTV